MGRKCDVCTGKRFCFTLWASFFAVGLIGAGIVCGFIENSTAADILAPTGVGVGSVFGIGAIVAGQTPDGQSSKFKTIGVPALLLASMVAIALVLIYCSSVQNIFQDPIHSHILMVSVFSLSAIGFIASTISGGARRTAYDINKKNMTQSLQQCVSNAKGEFLEKISSEKGKSDLVEKLTKKQYSTEHAQEMVNTVYNVQKKKKELVRAQREGLMKKLFEFREKMELEPKVIEPVNGGVYKRRQQKIRRKKIVNDIHKLDEQIKENQQLWEKRNAKHALEETHNKNHLNGQAENPQEMHSDNHLNGQAENPKQNAKDEPQEMHSDNHLDDPEVTNQGPVDNTHVVTAFGSVRCGKGTSTDEANGDLAKRLQQLSENQSQQPKGNSEGSE